MLRQRAHQLRAAIIAADALSMAAAFFAAYYTAGPLLTSAVGAREVLPIYRYLWVLACAVPVGWILFAAFGGYDLARFERWAAALGRFAAPLFVHGLFIVTLVYFAKEGEFARRVIALFIALNFLLVPLGRAAVLWRDRRSSRRESRIRRVLLVGSGPAAERFLHWAADTRLGLRIAGALASPSSPPPSVPVLGPPEALAEIIDQQIIDDVVIADPAASLPQAQAVIRQCEEVGCVVHILTDLFQAALSRPHVESFGQMSFLTFSATPYSPAALAAKRLLDIFGSLLLLTAASPFFLLFPILIRLTSPGPILFRQTRCGLNGRLFTMLKFRSMVQGAEARLREIASQNELDGPDFKIAHDPRITPVGRLMRSFSLDELPQLWNVLRGDMSLVGPRPPLPAETALYERWQRRRLSMRPGLTGLGQIRGRHRLTFEQWMTCDLEYIDTWTLWLDIRILLRTIPAVLKGGGV